MHTGVCGKRMKSSELDLQKKKEGAEEPHPDTPLFPCHPSFSFQLSFSLHGQTTTHQKRKNVAANRNEKKRDPLRKGRRKRKEGASSKLVTISVCGNFKFSAARSGEPFFLARAPSSHRGRDRSARGRPLLQRYCPLLGKCANAYHSVFLLFQRVSIFTRAAQKILHSGA